MFWIFQAIDSCYKPAIHQWRFTGMEISSVCDYKDKDNIFDKIQIYCFGILSVYLDFHTVCMIDIHDPKNA